jgi:hypothetical protein
MKRREGYNFDEEEEASVSIETVAEALEVLEQAIISQGVGITSDLVSQCFTYP